MPINELPRCSFLQSVAGLPLLSTMAGAPGTTNSPVRLESFDYAGVRLLPSRFLNHLENLRFNLGLKMPAGRHTPEDLAVRLHSDDHPLHFRVIDPPNQVIRSGSFFPYYAAKEGIPYRIYHDFSEDELKTTEGNTAPGAL